MIKTVMVGPSGLRSSEVALGTMTFGDSRAWGCTPEDAQFILSAFADAGGSMIDTAPNYADGLSEEAVGTFCQGRRNEMVLSTKYTAANSSHPLAGGNSRRSMVQSVEGSLRRLKTDRIDLLWLHFWDGTTPLEEILRAADDLVSAGKILHFGLSDTPAWLSARAATLASMLHYTPVVAVQLEYNAAARTPERELLPMAEALRLSAFCWGPLAAGALAGGTQPKRIDAARVPERLEVARAALDDISARTGIAPRRLALRWLMQSGPGRIPILGARTLEQIRETLIDAAESVDPSILQEVEKIADAGPHFPNELIQSSYLRKFALGDPSLYMPLPRLRN